MSINSYQFNSAFSRYHETFGMGLAWDIFWDYLTDNPRMRTPQKAKLLVLFLYSFGMNRGGRLEAVPMKQWEDFLSKTNTSIQILNRYKFGHLKNVEEDREIFDRALDDIREKLPRSSSKSKTLLSKILLAVTGNVPAYDGYFIEWLRNEQIGPQYPCYKSLYNIQNFLLESGISFSSIGTKSTRLGCSNTIPLGRIVDCVGWQIGYDLSIKKNEKYFSIKAGNFR